MKQFFARFDTKREDIALVIKVANDKTILILQQHQKSVKGHNMHKADGPDGVPGHVLKVCMDQLIAVLTDLFDLSSHHTGVPYCLKSSKLIPIPKSLL